MVVDDRDDLLPFLVFVARVANPIAPFLPRCCPVAMATLATNACQSDPSCPFAKDFRRRGKLRESPQKVRSLRRGHWRLRLGQQGLRRYGPKSSPANEIQAIYSGGNGSSRRTLYILLPAYHYGAKGFGLTRKVSYAQNHQPLG